MDRSEFKGNLIEWKSYLFFRLMTFVMLTGLFFTIQTFKERIALCVICICVFLGVLIFKYLYRFHAIVTEKEVQFLRFGRIHRRIDLASNYMSAYKYTSNLLFASLENHYVLIVNYTHSDGQCGNINCTFGSNEIPCRGLSKKAFEKFMTSVLWSSSNAKTSKASLNRSDANHFQQSFIFDKKGYVSMKKRYNYIRNGSFSAALFAIAVVLFVLMFLLPTEFPLNLQTSIMISTPFFLLAVIPFSKLIHINNCLAKRVPSHIEFQGDSLHIDNHSFSLSSITSIKASPADCVSLNDGNIRTICIAEGKKKTRFWLGDCLVNSDHDMQFQEYGMVYDNLVAFLKIANKFPKFSA